MSCLKVFSMDELDKGYRVGIPDGISTDIIKIDEILHQKIVNIVPLADTGTCPSDIIETNSIPLKDIALRMYPMADSPSDFLSFDVRIKIYETAPIAFYNENGYTGLDLIGEIGFINHNIVFPIIEVHRNFLISANKYHDKNVIIDTYSEMLSMILQDWYRIQVLLLHPRVEVIERKAVLQKLKGKDKITATSTGRKVKYIKRYYITPEDIDLMINGDRHYKRKCLSWYVIGHYREYKNGKRIFIQGYWKGELRALKRNFDERERVV